MIEQLFGSKTRVKLLKLFYSNPNRSYYVREITRTVEEQINSVRRELSNLLSLGIITSDSSNNRLYYEVNQKFEHYGPLQAIFAEGVSAQAAAETAEKQSKKSQKKTTKKKATADKSAATEEKPPVDTAATQAPSSTTVELPEAKRWHKVGNILAVAYSGVYTRDEAAGVDVVVVGDVVASKVDSVIAELEAEKHTELRYAVFDETEWAYRQQVRDKFWLQFSAAKKQIVYDKDGLFTNK